jgi:hypothetical protein
MPGIILAPACELAFYTPVESILASREAAHATISREGGKELSVPRNEQSEMERLKMVCPATGILIFSKGR